MLRHSILWTAFYFFTCFSPFSFSAEIKGVPFADETTVKGEKLVLNGLGLRTATFLKIKVYAAGLYLKNKSQLKEEILNSDTPKKLELVFVRDVSSNDIKNAWQESYEKNCTSECNNQGSQLTALKSMMEDIKSGDKLTYQFSKEGLSVFLNQKSKGTIAGESFSKNILAIWLGKEPPNKELQEGLLGKVH